MNPYTVENHKGEVVHVVPGETWIVLTWRRKWISGGTRIIMPGCSMLVLDDGQVFMDEPAGSREGGDGAAARCVLGGKSATRSCCRTELLGGTCHHKDSMTFPSNWQVVL